MVSLQALGSILAYLTDAKRKLRHVMWVNLREEAVLECDGHTHSLRWPGPPMASDQLEVRPSCPLHTPTLEAFWEIGPGESSEGPRLLLQMEKLRPQEEQTQGVADLGLLLWSSPWL